MNFFNFFKSFPLLFLGISIVFIMMFLFVHWKKYRTMSRVVGEETLSYMDSASMMLDPFAEYIKNAKRWGIAFIAGAALLLGFAYQGESVIMNWFYIPVGPLLIWGVSRLSAQMFPGCVLLLGHSSSDTINLHKTMLKSFFPPFRTVSLLNLELLPWMSPPMSPNHNDRKKTELIKYNPDNDYLSWHTFRLPTRMPHEEPHNWQDAVRLFTTTLPILVLDLRGRDVSNYVAVEIDIVIQKGHLYKTIFLTPDASAQMLSVHAKTLGFEIPEMEFTCVASIEELLIIFHNLFYTQRTIPTPQKPINMFHPRV